MKNIFIILLLKLFVGLCAGKDGEPLPEKSYEISCTFQEGLCGWTKSESTNFQFKETSNRAQIPYPPTGCKYLLLEENPSQKDVTFIESPEFMILPNIAVLQVNISFWIRSFNETAELKLLLAPMEGPSNGSEIEIWNISPKESSELWNATTINIQKHEAHKIKLILQASISSSDDLIAINEISVTEIDTSEMTVGDLPSSFSSFKNYTTCTNSAIDLKFNIIYIWWAVFGLWCYWR